MVLLEETGKKAQGLFIIHRKGQGVHNEQNGPATLSEKNGPLYRHLILSMASVTIDDLVIPKHTTLAQTCHLGLFLQVSKDLLGKI